MKKIFRGGGLELHFIDETFAIERVLIRDDASRLSWAKGKSFALPSGNNFLVEKDYSDPACFRAKFLYFSNITATVTVDEKDGAVRFSYVFRNEGKKPVSLDAGDLGVSFSFNDTFDVPSVTLRRRVHSFIRTEGAAYIRNARVSGELGAVSIIMTRGECASYRTELHPFRVDMGETSFDAPQRTLAPSDSFEWEFLLFSHQDEDDFIRKAKEYGFFLAEADHLVVREGEPIRIRSERAKELAFEDEHIPFTDGECRFTPKGDGEQVLSLRDGEDCHTVRCYVVPRDLFDRRIDHLLYTLYSSDVRGAFRAYDRSIGQPVMPKGSKDYAETTAMPLLFLLSEALCGREGVSSVVDEALSYYDNVRSFSSISSKGRNGRECVLFSAVKYEEYLYHKDVVCLLESALVLTEFFKAGYPCTVTPAYRVISSLREEGKESVAKELTDIVTSAADAVIARGNKYDEKKVFSPFAVCGALFLLSDAYLLTGKEYYIMNAKEHLSRVLAFFSPSCDYRTNALPILLSKDDRGVCCEMSPHLDDVVFALALERYARASGEDSYADMARNVLTALTSLFDQDGSARRGIPMPIAVDGKESCVEFSWGEDAILYLINLLFGNK